MRWEDIYEKAESLLKSWVNRIDNLNTDEDIGLKKEFELREKFDYKIPYTTLMKRAKRRTIFRFSGIAAAIAGIIVGIYAINRLQFTSPPEDMPLRPERTLSDGSKLLLDGQLQARTENSTLLHIDSSRITYIPQKKEIADSSGYNSIYVPRGETFKINLSDGSRITLNSESRLEYPVHFTKNSRNVRLDGEGYFEVASDVKKHFIVITNYGKITVLGTRFNLKCYADDTSLSAALIEGSIRFSALDSNSVLLTPGNLLTYKNGEIDIKPVNAENHIDWQKGYFNFENEPLESIVKTLSRWYDADFEFESEKLKHIKFSGRLEKYRSLESYFPFFEKSGELKFTKNGNKIRIK